MPLREALAQSLNQVSAYLMKRFGPEAVITLVRNPLTDCLYYVLSIVLWQVTLEHVIHHQPVAIDAFRIDDVGGLISSDLQATVAGLSDVVNPVAAVAVDAQLPELSGRAVVEEQCAVDAHPEPLPVVFQHAAYAVVGYGPLRVVHLVPPAALMLSVEPLNGDESVDAAQP